MSGRDLAKKLLGAVKTASEDTSGYTRSENRPVKIGTIDAAYSGTGMPKVLFDGETVMGTRGYAWTAPYQPIPGDRVVLVPVGRSYYIAGALETTEPSAYPRMLTGITPSSGAAGSSTTPVFWDGTTVVTFPVGYFTLAPVVVVTPVMGSSVVWGAITAITAANFTVRLMRVGATPNAATPIHWVARQATPSSATG